MLIKQTDTGPDFSAQIKEGDVFVNIDGQSRKTYLLKDGKKVNLSNRHLRRKWLKQQLTERSGI